MHKLKQFKCDENLNQYKHSMLVKTGTVLAHGVYEVDGDEVNVYLVVLGSIWLKYKGKYYESPEEYPPELSAVFTEGREQDDEDLEITQNNWFSISIPDLFYSEVVDDVDTLTVEDVKADFEEVLNAALGGK